jgi:hypothetical protein
MKTHWHIAGLSALATVLVLSVPFGKRAAEAVTNSKAATGLYVSLTDIGTTLIVQLGTNGNYQVHAEDRASRSRLSQEGHWKWDGRRQEFLLTPTNTVAFPYEFRRLRVDPRQSQMLQWIPLRSSGGAGGVIDYVRFKRKSD